MLKKKLHHYLCTYVTINEISHPNLQVEEVLNQNRFLTTIIKWLHMLGVFTLRQ